MSESTMNGQEKKWAENQAACANNFPTPRDANKLHDHIRKLQEQEQRVRDFENGRYNPVDIVNQPPHYTQGGIECLDAIEAALKGETDPFRAYLRGTILKYVWRGPHKGNTQEDYKKAEFYLKRLIKTLDPPKMVE